MNNRWMKLIVLGCMLAGFAHRNATAAFAPLVQVIDVKGACTAQLADSNETKDLKGGEGLAYGTTLRTPADGSLVLLLSADDKITIGGDAIVVVSQDPANNTLKLIRLHRGKLDLNLKKDYEKENGLRVITRCVAVNARLGGIYAVEATTEADLRVVTITCASGELDADGPDFKIPLLKDNDGITIACARDRSFIRLRCISGKFGVQIKDSNGAERIAEMITDSVIKILRKKSDTDGSTWIVTVLEVDPEGNVLVADTYPSTEPEGGGSGDDDGDEPIDEPGETPQGGGTFPTTTSSTTTSTTTTTVPPGDITPVGRS